MRLGEIDARYFRAQRPITGMSRLAHATTNHRVCSPRRRSSVAVT